MGYALDFGAVLRGTRPICCRGSALGLVMGLAGLASPAR